MEFEATNQQGRSPLCGLHQSAISQGVAQVLLAFIITLFAIPALAIGLPNQPASVTLAWDPSPTSDVTTYHVYVGTASGIYDDAYNTGGATTYVIPNLIRGLTYYFSATAVDSAGVESAFSAELEYKVPVLLDPANLTLSMQDGQPVLHGTSAPGSYFMVEASEDLSNWYYVGDAVAGDNGEVNYVDPDAAWYGQRFYRFQQ